jgi:DNA-binding Lrp family transcriptional regulator
MERENMKTKERDLMILSCLRQDARMKLTKMSKKCGVPISTIFDRLKILANDGTIQKCTSDVKFQEFGYNAKALVAFSVLRKNRAELLNILNSSHCVNSLYRINNGWDFLAETIFPGVKEVEEFLDGVEDKVKLKEKKVFYVIDELKKESFMSNPDAMKIFGVIRK